MSERLEVAGPCMTFTVPDAGGGGQVVVRLSTNPDTIRRFRIITSDGIRYKSGRRDVVAARTGVNLGHYCNLTITQNESRILAMTGARSQYVAFTTSEDAAGDAVVELHMLDGIDDDDLPTVV